MENPQITPVNQQHQPAEPQQPVYQGVGNQVHPQNQKKKLGRKVQELLWILYSAVAALLIFRFVFSLVAARQAAPYVDFVYQLTAPLMIPFNNMFGVVQSGPYRIEFEILVALPVYALVFFGLGRLLKIIFD